MDTHITVAVIIAMSALASIIIRRRLQHRQGPARDHALRTSPAERGAPEDGRSWHPSRTRSAPARTGSPRQL